ncbi:methyl-accepting chemotaxis protein [Lachnospiraceae bacterium G11]|nr:methyl-accepting chemotaxis protein [Lachnospiraceae bacterium G11]
MKQKKSLGLILKLVLIAVGAVCFTALVMILISRSQLSSTYESLIEEELKVACVELESKLSFEYDGDWALTPDGEMEKGGYVVQTEYMNEMDDIHKKTGLEYTLFYGDTRIITTIEKSDGSGRLVGTKATDAVIAQTLKGGQDYLGTNVVINNRPYFAYYIPLKNSDGTIVGMCFAGRLAEDVSAGIAKAVMMCLVSGIVIIVLVAVFGFFLNRVLSAQMHKVADNLEQLADGDLSVEVDEKLLNRGDELGIIGNSTKVLVDKISDIIGKLKNASEDLSANSENLSASAGQANDAAGQVAAAMDDISKGAVSQADSIQTAVNNTESIGKSIEGISDSVGVMNNASVEMKESCKTAMDTLNNLIKHSEKVATSVDSIATKIGSTNESANAISELTDAINSIASQTNLLSLNASIEAARAGEAGKGFAVVASEISTLADQSKQSADKINEIVVRLIKDASESVEVMKVLSENVVEQKQQLSATQEDMDKMQTNINGVAASADDIADKISNLRSDNEGLGQIIEDLSAISEENAASTEETNASVEELSATFQMINDDADGLNNLAQNMQDTIAYFH